MGFRFQAIDASGKAQKDVIDAASEQEAIDALRERGLFVTDLEPDAGTGATNRKKASGAGKPRFRDVVLFTQQMTMLLGSGAQVTEALANIEEQSERPGWRAVVSRIRVNVQEGQTLSTALAGYPKLFSGIYVSMITAGEAGSGMTSAFERLSDLTRKQQEAQRRIIGAISYPAVLLLLCLGVLGIMLGFVLPRFAEMFDSLGVELPFSTSFLIAASNTGRDQWPWLLAAITAVVTGIVYFYRSEKGQVFISRTVVRLPVFGGLVRNIITARICRIWGQLLESKVALLDAVELINKGTTNYEFRALMDQLTEAITGGNRVGPELKKSWLIPPTFAGAIATGEESGRLSDSLLFVGNTMDDQNTEVLGSLTRVIEPLILAAMGLIVGVIAFSLFIPMFDIAAMGGK